MPNPERSGMLAASSAARLALTKYHKQPPPLLRQAVAALFCIACILAGSGLLGCVSTGSRLAGEYFLEESCWPERQTTRLDKLAEQLKGSEIAGLNRGHPEQRERALNATTVGLGLVLTLAPVPDESEDEAAHRSRLFFISWPPQEGSMEIAGGMPWMLYEPPSGAATGLAVILGGSKHVRQALLKHGWVILETPGPERYFHRRAHPLTIEIAAPEDMDAAAREIARQFDDELSEWAYGTEAVLKHLAHERPDLPHDRTALLGFSIGAIATPTAAARLPDEFKAAVLTAGGADLLTIARTTAKQDSGLIIDWYDDAPKDSENRLRDAYLSYAKLDPYHAAAALRDTPVLIYHAAFDRVVPATTGETLFERLGGAQRYVFPVGHQQLLRTIMRLQAGAIADQLEFLVDQHDH